ncbi:MAG: NAD(P)-binding protein [Dehalococcoidia bacterium]|nr:NAD(P)-binding protein [Dehalococcoidia bacterium]
MVKKAAAKSFDVLIIGGGPGGLAIGSLLARDGVKTAIIEKQSAPGGRLRSVDFHGCRVDSAIHFLVSLAGAVERTYTYKMFTELRLPFEYKTVPWPMAKITKEKPGQIEFFTMDPKLGAANFFAFFAFATGVDMDESTRTELTRIATITEDMSEQECRKVVNVSFADWLEKNTQDPMAKAVLQNMGPIIGAPIKDVNFGMVANAFGTFNRVGAPLIWYPKNGTLETAIIAPLAGYFKEHGGKIITKRAVRNVIIERGRAKGVIASDDDNSFMMEEYTAPVVICAMPLFQAVAQNIIKRSTLTKDWAETVKRAADLAIHDLSGFYLLDRDVIPRDGHGWIHMFDTDYGIPTYVGDLCLGTYTNAREVPGKQLVCGLVVGSSEANNFGIPTRMDMVRAGRRKWLAAAEKAYPGFNKAIQYEGMNLQLNFTRYAYAVSPVELDIQSPNIKGLYFAGDSIWSIGTPMSDKCFQIAFPLRERVLQYLRA